MHDVWQESLEAAVGEIEGLERVMYFGHLLTDEWCLVTLLSSSTAVLWSHLLLYPLSTLSWRQGRHCIPSTHTQRPSTYLSFLLGTAAKAASNKVKVQLYFHILILLSICCLAHSLSICLKGMYFNVLPWSWRLGVLIKYWLPWNTFNYMMCL
jgi:hypothetical protein